MRSIGWSLLFAGSALAMPHGAAHANNCYFVYDRADNVIYRDQQPPVDMSDRGTASRDAMRQRGEYLMVIDADRCAQVAPATATASTGAASVEDIVAGMRPYMGRGGGRVTAGGAAAGRTGSSVRTATPAAASSSRGSTTRAY